MTSDIRLAFEHPIARAEAAGQPQPRRPTGSRCATTSSRPISAPSSRSAASTSGSTSTSWSRSRRRARRSTTMSTGSCPTTRSPRRSPHELAEERLNLLETLAERIADRILHAPQALRVFVRIEKLDRGPGALGRRDRARPRRDPARGGRRGRGAASAGGASVATRRLRDAELCRAARRARGRPAPGDPLRRRRPTRPGAADRPRDDPAPGRPARHRTERLGAGRARSALRGGRHPHRARLGDETRPDLRLGAVQDRARRGRRPLGLAARRGGAERLVRRADAGDRAGRASATMAPATDAAGPQPRRRSELP